MACNMHVNIRHEINNTVVGLKTVRFWEENDDDEIDDVCRVKNDSNFTFMYLLLVLLDYNFVEV